MPTQESWNEVDALFERKLVGADAALHRALEESAAAGLPAIAVSAAQGKLLHLLVRITSAKRVLEVGTLGGYSTLWMARALPEGGRITTLEISKEHARVAQQNLAHAGVAERVEIRVGDARDSLAALAQEKREPFDFVFIDADKPSNRIYFDWARKLGRKGTVIVVDNVGRGGKIVLPESKDDPGVRGVLELLDAMEQARPEVSATAIQTVGTKGYDGFAIAVVG
jgi:predicted O-methyltransferase YrrM